jgi:hypothetical protein
MDTERSASARVACGKKAVPRTPAKDDPAQKSSKDDLPAPHLEEARDFLRFFLVAEKNCQLFPLEGKVVQASLRNLQDSLAKFHEKARSPLKLKVTRTEILYEDHVIHQEEHTARSLAHLMHRDSVREVTFLEGTTLEELSAFLSCFRRSFAQDDDEEDFTSLFWEKDCIHIHLEVAQDFFGAEGDPVPPEARESTIPLDAAKFKIEEDDAERLEELMRARKAGDPPEDRTFELTEEEAEKIRELSREEESYFPLYDLVDILFELAATNPDLKELQHTLKLLRSIIFAFIENLDFEHAVNLLQRCAEGMPQGLPDAHRSQIRDMIRSFSGKATLEVLSTFLQESTELPADHGIFRLMKLLGSEALPQICTFLGMSQHLAAMCDVLSHIGAGSAEVLCQHISNPDPQIALAMIEVVLRTDPVSGHERIAVALKHPNEGVRINAAKILMQRGESKSASAFMDLLKDPSKALVSMGLSYFSKVSCPEAYAPLAELSKGRSFRKLDELSQEKVFTACVRADPLKAAALLSRTLGRGICWTRSSFRRKSAALYALLALGGDTAVEIAGRFTSRRKGRLALVARKVLASLTEASLEPEKEVQGV